MQHIQTLNTTANNLLVLIAHLPDLNLKFHVFG